MIDALIYIRNHLVFSWSCSKSGVGLHRSCNYFKMKVFQNNVNFGKAFLDIGGTCQRILLTKISDVVSGYGVVLLQIKILGSNGQERKVELIEVSWDSKVLAEGSA